MRKILLSLWTFPKDSISSGIKKPKSASIKWTIPQRPNPSSTALPFTSKRNGKIFLTWSFIVDISLSNISCVLRVESRLLKYIEVAPTASRTKCCCSPPSLPGWQTTSKLLSFLSSHERGGSGTPGKWDKPKLCGFNKCPKQFILI